MRKAFLTILALLTLLSCSSGDRNIDNLSAVSLIAHAGGAVDGVSMTNSYEALCAARDNGYKYIELDLLLTSDSVLVAMHDWAGYNAAMGNSERGDMAPTFAELQSQGLPGDRTLLTHTDINDFFLANDSLFFVTDKISSPSLLDKYFPQLRSRMVVEAFSYNDYVALQERGYGYVSYSCMADDVATASLKHILFHFLFPGKRIDSLALHTSAFDYGYVKLLLALFDFEISLFTVNNVSEIPQKAFHGLKFMYTDSLLPGNIKRQLTISDKE